jgi:hypothetical protein
MGPDRNAQGNALGIDDELSQSTLKWRDRICCALAHPSGQTVASIAQLFTSRFVHCEERQVVPGPVISDDCHSGEPVSNDFKSR